MSKILVMLLTFLSLFRTVGHSPDRTVIETDGRASIATGQYQSTNLVSAASADPCDEYQSLENGDGVPALQTWFNYLNIPDYARFRMACVHHWDGGQFDCLFQLWSHESEWGNTAPHNIPQLKPDPQDSGFRNNQREQVRRGLEYIHTRPDYHNPCDAWSLWQKRKPHWY